MQKKGFVLRRDKAFSLVELLVVIAVIALLMAILLPALQRVKLRAKDTICRSNLRQWGTIFLINTDDNNGKFSDDGADWWYDCYIKAKSELQLCPMAPAKAHSSQSGATFRAWKIKVGSPPDYIYGSYGANKWMWRYDRDPGLSWLTPYVACAAEVPLVMDCHEGIYPWGIDGREEAPSGPEPLVERYWPPFCMNRHNGGLNGLFMDWSVRHVGVKELWTLKWHREWNTAGPWTKAGGVQLDDWPEWMRKFKDY